MGRTSRYWGEARCPRAQLEGHKKTQEKDPWDLTATSLSTSMTLQSLIRRLLAVYTLPSWGRAELALSLLQETPRNYELLDVVEAVRHSQDRAFLRRLLAQECAVCGWALPRNRVSPSSLYLVLNSVTVESSPYLFLSLTSVLQLLKYF